MLELPRSATRARMFVAAVVPQWVVYTQRLKAIVPSLLQLQAVSNRNTHRSFRHCKVSVNRSFVLFPVTDGLRFVGWPPRGTQAHFVRPTFDVEPGSEGKAAVDFQVKTSGAARLVPILGGGPPATPAPTHRDCNQVFCRAACNRFGSTDTWMRSHLVMMKPLNSPTALAASRSFVRGRASWPKW